MENFCERIAGGARDQNPIRKIPWRPLSALMLLVSLVLFVIPKLLLAQTDPSNDKVYVDSVQVEGNQRIEEEAILSVVRTQRGDLLDRDQLDRDLRDIYRMRFFTDAAIELRDGPNGKIVIFKVTEKPTIGEIVYEGNDNINETDLNEEIGINLYSILDDNEVKQSINRIIELYKNKGYYNAEIKSEVTSIPNNEVRLTYEIDEKDKVYIREIEFLGNTEYDDGDLKDLMETSEKGVFSWLTSSGLLDQKRLEFDSYKITSFYHNHGFINAKLGEPEIIFDKELEGLKIVIEVEEGPQYAVGNVAVEGDLIKSPDELLRVVQIGKEKVFNREVVRNDINALREIYVDQGFAHADVTPRTWESDETYLVNIVYFISKGPKVRFERINILGNTITRDKVIRRELKAVEGNEYSGAAIRKSKENLDRLGFFEDVAIENKKGSRDDLMVLDITVKEKPTGSFSVGAGFSSEDSLFAMFEVSQNNLFGRGQRLKAATRISGLTNLFDVTFTEPWLFDTRLSGEIRLYKWKQEYEDYTYNDLDFEEYDRDSLGGSLGMGFPIDRIDEYTRASVNYTYDDSDIGNVPQYATKAWKEMEGRNVTSSMTFGIHRDTRDKPWDTSKGSYNSLSFQFAGRGLGGDVNYNKITASTAWYFPLPKSTVFLTRGNWGYIEEHAGGLVPVYHKFRLGGLNSIRGFDYGDISPTQTVRYQVDSDGDGTLDTWVTREDPVGGQKMMYYNLEYRFPLLKKQGFTGLVFFDFGNVWTKNENYTFSDIKKSAGFGIRWYSPMGPLRIEWGKNLSPEDDEESSKWEFSIGGAF